MADTVNSPSPKEDIMGLFDSLKNMFAHHEHHHGASIGQPLTLADAKAVLAFIVVHQQLADMRKVADLPIIVELFRRIVFNAAASGSGLFFVASTMSSS